MSDDDVERLREENLALKYRLAQVVPLSEHFAVVDPLRAAVALHRPHKNQNGLRERTCWQCGHRWPCRTRRVADGEVDGGT